MKIAIIDYSQVGQEEFATFARARGHQVDISGSMKDFVQEHRHLRDYDAMIAHIAPVLKECAIWARENQELKIPRIRARHSRGDVGFWANNPCLWYSQGEEILSYFESQRKSVLEARA